MDRPLSDDTGLTRTYEWRFAFRMRSESGDPSLPSVYTAIQEQLGLKLEPSRGPVEVSVITRNGLRDVDLQAFSMRSWVVAD